MVLGQARITDEGVAQLKSRLGSYFKGEYVWTPNYMMTKQAIAHWCDGVGDYNNKIYRDEEYAKKTKYGSIIIHSLETGKPSVFNGNVKNKHLITNLPEGCCVEVPCLADKEGIHPCFVGDLPAQLAALNRTNINVQELAVRGIVEKDKTKIFQSILLDPLTGALLTIDETRQLVDELFLEHKEYMQGYK